MTLKDRYSSSAHRTRSHNQGALSREAARADAHQAFAFEEEGLLLDRYRPLETLGTGGYGTVFAAWDEQLKRRVAIKEIPFEHTPTGEPAGLAEARTAALLTHPNIATVYDFIATDDRAYLIMEYVDGITLADIPSEDLNDDTIATIVKSMASAIAHAHKNGVLHLDIKPRNILINHEGRIKIIDFGIAELSGLNGHGSASGGTIGYMPLEQLEGTETSERTDEWAFASVVYELCTDEFPYADAAGFEATYTQMLKAQQFDEPSLLQTNDPLLDEIFATALSTNPDDRYPTVKKFSTALLERLGDVAEGRKELKEVVADLTNDEEEIDLSESKTHESKPPLFSPGEIGRFIIRLLIGLAGGACIWQLFEYANLTTRDTALIPLFVSLIVAAILELAPRLGGIIAPLALSVLLILSATGHLWAYGLGLALISCVWWYIIGRKSNVMGGFNALFVVIALEINLLAKPWLSSTFPTLIKEHLTTINISLAVTYVLVSMLGAWIISKRKDKE